MPKMRGTIPQWIGALAIVVIAVVVVARWPELTPDWVTAGATVVLAFAALVALFGVFVPLQLERARRRSVHLETIIAIVLEPIRLKLADSYAQVLSRSVSPLECWHPQGLKVTAQFGSIPSGSPLADDESLYDSIYADIKRNHYPRLLADWERFEEDCEKFGQSALESAQGLEGLLRRGCDLPDFAMDQSGIRGCFYASLALYAFNRQWLNNYDYLLSEQKEGEQWKLWCLNISTYYGRGSHDEMIKLKALVEPAIKLQDITGLKDNGQVLLTRLEALQAVIASIRTNEQLRGDCIATK